VTLTDPAMTRFIMSIRQAVALLIDSCGLCCGGEVFVTKMPVIRIEDLARVMIAKLAPVFGFGPERIEIRIMGISPGEKMYEELMNQEETRRSLELNDYFVILPAFAPTCRDQRHHYPQIRSRVVEKPYHSGNVPALSMDELAVFLEQNHLLGKHDSEPE
jgi:FlaA1/EpsC-like NDP-sugar epimerase